MAPGQIYDVPAEGYDELYGKEQYEKYVVASAALGESIREFSIVADIGCATGLFGEYLRSVGFEGLYIGVDVLEDRLEIMRRKSSGSWMPIQADAEHLPLRTNSIDLAVCITVIHLLDVGKAVEELLRISREVIIITLLRNRIDLRDEVLKHLNGLSIKGLSIPGVKDEVFIAYKTIRQAPREA
ncbi:MAG: class I SAM-dependent methyltransferase [Aigarchaeota archaeon]|nr:class I SAM-dependent methyltransferase [Aigarchaeota archaeon]